jgi:uncharacterized protein YrzB (UPF0473 family)
MTSILKQQYGSEITLFDEQGHEVIYRILAEIPHQDKRYAILQNDAMKKEGDIEVFLLAQSSEGEWELETVDDEDWEDIAELYDEMIFRQSAGKIQLQDEH